MSEMIKTGGINVAPAEVEEFLCGHPAVSEAGVVGSDDVNVGQIVVAFIVGDRPVSEGELRDYCQGQIAGFKIPVEFRFVDSLPATTTGKLSRRGLQGMVEEATQSEE